MDVERLDDAVASLPPLRLLTELRIVGLYVGEQAVRQLLVNCPEVVSLELNCVS